MSNVDRSTSWSDPFSLQFCYHWDMYVCVWFYIMYMHMVRYTITHLWCVYTMIAWLHTILYDSCFGVDYYTPETRDVHTLIWWAMIMLMIIYLINYSSSGSALVYIYIYSIRCTARLRHCQATNGFYCGCLAVMLLELQWSSLIASSHMIL